MNDQKMKKFPQILLCASLLVMTFCCQAFAHPLSRSELFSLAEQGDPAAQWQVGKLFGSGRSGIQSDAEAVSWYMKSAAQGYAPAEVSLGGMYAGGYGGLSEDHALAREWFGKAAAQGEWTGKWGLILEDSSLISYIRTLPVEVKDLIFRITVAVAAIVLLGLLLLPVVLMLKFILKRKLQR
jgi:hypothetical protein